MLTSLLVGLFLGTGAAGAALDAEALRPYFLEGDARTGARRYREGDYTGAVKSLEAALKKVRRTERPQVELLLALSQQRRGDHPAAAPLFEELAESLRVLAPFCHYRAAVSRYALGQHDRALEQIGKVDADSAFSDDAEHLRGDTLRALGRWEELRATMARYLTERPKGIRRAEAQYKLAEGLERTGKKDAAIAGYRKVIADYPVDSWAGQAQLRLQALGAAPGTPPVVEMLARGKAQFKAQQLRAAERTLGEVVKRAQGNPAVLCDAQYHLGQSIFKQRQRARSAGAFGQAADTCRRAGNQDLTAKALYQQARGLLAQKEHEAAAALFLRMEREHGGHSFADDARVRASEAYAGLDEKDDRVDAVLAQVAKKHPTGDMRAEALFRLAFRAWRAADLERMDRWLAESLKVVPREDGWAEEGRTLYWLGRLRERQGKAADADAAWERCVRTYPLSYYALLSANRLAERAQGKVLAVLGELGQTVDRDAAWAAPEGATYAQPAFRRGLELAKLGLFDEARRELARAGVDGLTREEAKALGLGDASDGDEPSEAGERSGDDAHPRWVIARVLDAAGMWMQSHAIPRYALTSWRLDWPRGKNRKRWVVAFPRAFEREITTGASAAQIPPELAYAISREESAFNPRIRSHAQALGLMQLLVATARRDAPPGVKVDKETLLDPRVNALCGTRELAGLLGRFRGNYALAIAGYNAGPAAVGRWLGERGTMALDEFIELIPYDETRGYTKRVLSSFFTYQFLYGQRGKQLPRLAVTAPAGAS